ncbi:beta-1,3-galactosyltransferase 5-like [Coccinella septempunctata]|uniref:beta-1,3-galactosyltransferase 5-like n=1 Tax=Coccinella septempunctata TaxID=41139 RepID=UPI001D073E5C|nr:beta-1,3-galactosyltransferase 5-like [Coccinella septempunctata]
MLYEYGSPLHAESVAQYRKEYAVSNLKYYEYPVHLLPSSDYHRLINLSFTFHTLNLDCGLSNPFILVIIYTAPENFAKRKVIRQTWASKRSDVLTLFALGETSDLKINSRLQDENRIHKDFLQGSFQDSYKNLTYKHVMMLKYLIYHCPEAKYLLKADDDIYINLPALLNFLKDVSPIGAKNFLFCPPNYAKVVRSFRQYSSKWRLTFKEYPHRYHPPSCNGFFFVYSKNVAFQLYRQAQNTEYFWLEDVHITGHLFKKLGINHVNARPFMIIQKKLAEIMKTGVIHPWPFYFSGPDLSENEIEWLNDYVVNREV